MTDRVTTLVVTLDRQYRDDDVQCIVDALEMVKCVLKVDKVVSNYDYHAARTQVRAELSAKLLKVLSE